MTSPKIATFHNRGTRFYEHPTKDLQVPGVTSVLNMLPKGYLKFWAAKLVAESAVEMTETGELAMMVKRDPDGAVDYLKRAPDRNTKKAADAGSSAHSLFELRATGQPIGEVTDSIRPFLEHFDDFLETVQPEFDYVEETVWSEKHSYAGSLDFIARIQGEVCIGDNKTTRSGVHDEVALQLAAYKHADYIVGEDGEANLLPDIVRGVVVHVRPEGWALYEVPVTEDVFGYFLALREVWNWDRLSGRKKDPIPRQLLAGAAKQGTVIS